MPGLAWPCLALPGLAWPCLDSLYHWSLNVTTPRLSFATLKWYAWCNAQSIPPESLWCCFQLSPPFIRVCMVSMVTELSIPFEGFCPVATPVPVKSFVRLVVKRLIISVGNWFRTVPGLGLSCQRVVWRPFCVLNSRLSYDVCLCPTTLSAPWSSVLRLSCRRPFQTIVPPYVSKAFWVIILFVQYQNWVMFAISL